MNVKVSPNLNFKTTSNDFKENIKTIHEFLIFTL